LRVQLEREVWKLSYKRKVSARAQHKETERGGRERERDCARERERQRERERERERESFSDYIERGRESGREGGAEERKSERERERPGSFQQRDRENRGRALRAHQPG